MKRPYLKPILVLLVVALAVISPVGAGVVHAGLGEIAVSLVAQIVHALFYFPSTLALRASAFVFDSVVPYSLGLIATGATSAFQNPFIADGWKIMRDLTNIVFIFAMLYIAITTILQVGAGKNTRSLLVNIILVALFVNFSLFLAQVVIDGANLLAIEFYKALSASPQGLAAIFITGFNPQKLVGVSSFESWIGHYDASNALLLVIYLFGGVVQWIAAYMIFWAAFLFIGRIVILWILMILSPIAFAAYILPETKRHFQKWWSTLLEQAFVAPIFLFFFFIFALFIDGGAVRTLFQTAVQSTGSTNLMQIILEISLGFSLVVGFLLVSLRMTKSIGGEAAAWATKAVGFTIGAAAAVATGPAGAARLAKLAGAVGMPAAGMGAGATVGRVAGVPLRPFREAAFARGRAAAGEAAKRVVEEGAKPGIVGGALRGLGIARGAAQAEAQARAGVKADVERAAKDLEGFSEAALKTEIGYATATPERKTAAIGILGKRGKLQPNEKGERLVDPEIIKEILKAVKERGYDIEKEIENKYLWQYATKEKDRTRAAERMNVEAFKEIAKQKDKEGGPSDFFDGDDTYNAFIKNATTAHFNILADPETNKQFADNLFEKLKAEIEKAKEVKRKKLVGEGKTEEARALVYTATDYFKDKEEYGGVNNSRLAAWTEGMLGQGELDTHNIPYKKKKTKEEKDEEKEAKQKTEEEKEAQKKKEEEQKKREKDERFYQDFFGAEKK